EQRHGDFLFLCPRFLRERIIAADSINGGVQTCVSVQACADFAHFHCASPREGHGKGMQKCVFLSEIVAQFDLLWPVSGLGRQHEIWRFSSNSEWHKWILQFEFNGGDFQYRFDSGVVKTKIAIR